MNRKPVVFTRPELLQAELRLGDTTIPLSDYATTGLRVVAVGPSGSGKTNAGCLIAEQLAKQGWVAVLCDPEGELSALYAPLVRTPAALTRALAGRQDPIVVVPVATAEAFLPVGQAILEAADTLRKPLFLLLDEGQLFSTSSRKKDPTSEASTLVNDLAGRGRKRCLDLFVSAPKFSASLSRSVFAHKNLTLIARQEDPLAWPALAPQFKGTGITYADLTALATGEFFCFSRRGIDKVEVDLAEAFKAVAPRARRVEPRLPQRFSEWDRALRALPTERLRALTPDVIALLGTVASLSAQQLTAGTRALQDELGTRSH